MRSRILRVLSIARRYVAAAVSILKTEDGDYLLLEDGSRFLLEEEVSTPLLLDTYTGAAAAYSLRKLRTAYSGSCIRVRRSSDSAEQDFGFLNGVLDTAAMLDWVNALGAGNGFVTTWYDQSGNAKNATQATAASQPKIVASGAVITQDSKPTVQFATGLFILCGDISNSTDCDAFIVYKTPASQTILANSNPSLVPYFAVASPGDSNPAVYSSYGSPVTTVNGVLVSPHTRAALYTALAQSRALLRVESADFSIQTQFSINGFSGFDNVSNVQELIVYGSDQSANMPAIEANINSHYSIY